MQLRTVNNVFSAAKLPLELVRGEGYFYFVFDDGGKNYETLSVMVYRLNDLPLARWVEEGKQFAARKMGVEHA